MENFICNQYEERLAILNTENIKNLWMNNKVRGDYKKRQSVCVFFRVCRKFEFFIFQVSVATFLR